MPWPPGPSPTTQAHYVAAALPQLPCTTRHTIRHSFSGLSYTQKPHISYYHTRTYAKHNLNIMNPPFLLTFTSYRARTLSSMLGGCTVCLNLAIVTRCFSYSWLHHECRSTSTVAYNYSLCENEDILAKLCYYRYISYVATSRVCLSMLCTVHVHRYFYQ